jgi:4-hydroxy-tetrahydrodipicolinate synthase
MLNGYAIGGVLPVVQTPFRSSGEIDFESLRSEVGWILDQGVSGVTVGMVSEILRLSTGERLELAEAVCDAVRGHRPPSGAAQIGGPKSAVIACGAESTRSAVDLAVHAAKIGADAVMATPPMTVALDDDALWVYYSEIIQRAAIPLVVQDASGYVGQPLSIDLQVRLLEAYGDMIYFKPEAPPIGLRLSRLRDATGGQARIFEGSAGAALVDSYRRGIVGSMPGAEVCWAVQALWRALEAQDWSAAYALSGPLLGLVMLQPGLDGYIAVEKHLLVRQGVLSSARSRGPQAFRLDPETVGEVDRLYDLLRAATDQVSATVR